MSLLLYLHNISLHSTRTNPKKQYTSIVTGHHGGGNRRHRTKGCLNHTLYTANLIHPLPHLKLVLDAILCLNSRRDLFADPRAQLSEAAHHQAAGRGLPFAQRQRHERVAVELAPHAREQHTPRLWPPHRRLVDLRPSDDEHAAHAASRRAAQARLRRV